MGITSHNLSSASQTGHLECPQSGIFALARYITTAANPPLHAPRIAAQSKLKTINETVINNILIGRCAIVFHNGAFCIIRNDCDEREYCANGEKSECDTVGNCSKLSVLLIHVDSAVQKNN